jgi:hypothetical protein
MTEPDIPAPAGVLSSLPTARPQRRSPKRDQAAPTRAPRAQARPAAPRTRPPRAKRPTATRPARPTVVEAPEPGPAKSPMAAQGYATASGAVEPPSRTALFGSVLGGAGELAEIGVAASRHVLRSLYGRLPHR